MNNLKVMMIRETLDDIPEFFLPEGFSFRTYQCGDAKLWRNIQSRADKFHDFGENSFQEKFGSDIQILARRQLYLIAPDGEAVGTATAWTESVFEPAKNYGLVHWVAIVPEYQGRKLAKPLMGELLKIFRRENFSQVILRTSSARIPAISLYHKFGFRPLIHDKNDEHIWRDIASRVKL